MSPSGLSFPGGQLWIVARGLGELRTFARELLQSLAHLLTGA
jgi:hypothetical protein